MSVDGKCKKAWKVEEECQDLRVVKNELKGRDTGALRITSCVPPVKRPFTVNQSHGARNETLKHKLRIRQTSRTLIQCC